MVPLEVGAHFPEKTYVITQEKMDRYSRYALGGRDTANIHTNVEKARRAGLPGPVAHGRHPVAFFSEAMLRAFGAAWVCSGHLDVTLTRLIFPGDTLTLRGEVVARRPDDAGEHWDVRMTLVNQKGETVQSAEANVRVVAGEADRP